MVRSPASPSIELAGLGALPFGTLKLADMGADVIRVDRTAEVPRVAARSAARGSRSGTAAGGRSPSTSSIPTASRWCSRWPTRADALVESFRPGVAERLGVGPEPAMARNPKLVYGRLTGWGQDGPLGAERRATR